MNDLKLLWAMVDSCCRKDDAKFLAEKLHLDRLDMKGFLERFNPYFKLRLREADQIEGEFRDDLVARKGYKFEK